MLLKITCASKSTTLSVFVVVFGGGGGGERGICAINDPVPK